jgi:phage gp29-like protein
MATAPQKEVQPQAVPPLPPKGEAIGEERLYLTQISLYRNSLGFGGVQNPSTIWASMTYNHPTTMAYFREIEEKDENVANCLDTLKLAVLQRERLVTPKATRVASKGSQQSEEVAKDVADFVTEQLANLPNFHAILDCMLDAPGYGFSVQENIYDISEGQVSISDVKDCPQELFLFGQRYRPQVGPMQLLDSPWAMDGQPQPQEKFQVFSYRSRGQNRMGRPLLRGVFWPSWFLRNAQRLWLQFCEKGTGTVMVPYNDSDNEQEKSRAAEIAKAAHERPALAVPATLLALMKTETNTRSTPPAMYEKLYQAMQYNITRRVLGETLTSFGNEGGTGAKAQGEVHAETLLQRIIELCRALEAVVNRQLVRPLVLWNFGPDVPMPYWGFDLEEEEDLVARTVIDSALQRMGKQFPTSYVVDRYSVPAVDGEPEILVPNVNAPQVALQARDVSNFAEGRLATWWADFVEGTKRQPRLEEVMAAAKAANRVSNYGEMSPEMSRDFHEVDRLIEDLVHQSKSEVLASRVREILAASGFRG